MSEITETQNNCWLLCVCWLRGGSWDIFPPGDIPVCVCVCVCWCCDWVLQSNVKHIVLYLLVCEVSTSPMSVIHPPPPPTHRHQLPPRPSPLTGRAGSGNRRSTNPRVTPRPVGSGLSIVAQPLSILFCTAR